MVIIFCCFVWYLAALITFIICFVRDVSDGEIIIENKIDLMRWILSIVFWPIVLIVGLITKKRE